MKRMINLVVCIMLVFACVGQSQASLFKIDFGNKSGTDSGWDLITTRTAIPPAVSDISLTDWLGLDNDVDLAVTIASSHGSNNFGGAGATVVDGIAVPASVNGDYMWTLNGQTITLEFKNLDAGTYNVSVFAGRTTDPSQHGTLWVGALGDKPGATNTGDYANGSSTMELTVAAGQSLWFVHLDDDTGGTSGMILVLEPATTATAPDPSNGESDVEIDLSARLVSGAVSWDGPVDPNGTVLGYNLYMDPNEIKVLNATAAVPGTLYSSLQSNGQTGTSFDPGADLDYDATYYWRVDAVVDLDYVPGTDPNVLTGTVWSFDAELSIPVITDQPVDQYAFPGETATFTISADSVSPVTYTWKRSIDYLPENGDETIVGGDADSLDIFVDDAEDQARYYCVVDNGVAVVSDVVYLQINRQTGRYDFENNADDTSSPYPIAHGTWAGGGSQEAYSTGVIGSNAAVFTGDPDSYISVPAAIAPLNDDPAIGGSQLGTVAYWIKTTSTSLMTVMGTINNSSDVSTFEVVHNQGGTGAVRVYHRLATGDSIYIAHVDTDLVDGQWHHIAFTWDFSETGSVLYIDGEAVANKVHLGNMDWNPWENDMTIGAVNNGGTVESHLTGELDDVNFYNFTLNNIEVADLYLQGYPDEALCINPYPAQFDLNDNCKIDLGDFAAFASIWLECGLYPVSKCD